MTKPTRSSPRFRKSPTRFSKQTVSSSNEVKKCASKKRPASTAGLDQVNKLRTSKRIKEKQTVLDKKVNHDTSNTIPISTIQSAGGRKIPMRSARNQDSYKNSTSSKPKSSKQGQSKLLTDLKQTIADKEVRRRPRVIIIGAGVSGLACARELSERRHDVLVLEARNRLGGRLRTIDLMMDDAEMVRKRQDEISDAQSELFKVKKWSPVDVGGAFIHGTGAYTTNLHSSHLVGSHDFGMSKSRQNSESHNKHGERKSSGPMRKSSRIVSNNVASDVTTKSKSKRVNSNGPLNPVYSLAKQLRLPLHTTAGAHTCLVDHNGAKIRDEVDEDISRDFNEILDLATKCCQSGQYEWKDQNVSSDSTDATIAPDDAFESVFQECKRHHDYISSRSNRELSPNDAAVRNNLFQWHIANLEMSCGAPIKELGQKWNNDEPFGYGGDHSYFENGTRDIIEALVEGFDCRGVCNRRDSANNRSLLKRGIIQCGIQVNGIKVVEREDAKERRRQSKQPICLDESKLRRSGRSNKGKQMWSSTPTKNGDEDMKVPSFASSYDSDESTLVHVTTSCGLTLEADAVVVSIPLALLSAPKGCPGHIDFSPPLPQIKKDAISRLGVGSYNKCCMSFETAFWDHLFPTSKTDENEQQLDFIGHASDEHGEDILFLCMKKSPILVAIYGGSEYSKKVESIHDEEVVNNCMTVLKKMCNEAKTSQKRKTRRHVDEITIPEWPIDYFVSRWGSDPYSRGAFVYVPPSTDGFKELLAMSTPIYDFYPSVTTNLSDDPKRPLILFAGEATTPYHPSTIHGAFETGIREAYRLDFALEPDSSGFTFNETFIYKPTFSVRHNPAAGTRAAAGMKEGRCPNYANTTGEWSFDNDISILRGVDSFGCSFEGMKKIKSKIMAADDTHKAKSLLNRYKFLRHLLDDKQQLDFGWDAREWSLPGGSWLTSVESQVSKGKVLIPAKNVAESQLKLLSKVKVGTKLAILWPVDDTYYPGVITAYHPMTSGKYGSCYSGDDKGFVYSIHYDDGSEETLNLALERFRLNDLAVGSRRSIRQATKKWDPSYAV